MTSSRTFDGVSTYSILSSGMPSSFTISFATSTSKPSGLPDRPFWPKPGWSNLVPTLIFWALFSRSMVLPAAKSLLPAPVPSSSLSPPQADRPSARVAAAATAATRL